MELNRAHFDSEASSYDAKHEKATGEIARRIESRLDFIGVDWVEDDDSEEEDESKAGKTSKREVRLLDYACGTGSMSRVSLSLHTTSRAVARYSRGLLPHVPPL